MPSRWPVFAAEASSPLRGSGASGSPSHTSALTVLDDNGDNSLPVAAALPQL